MNSTNFDSRPFGVFYKNNPNSSTIKSLRKAGVRFLFIDPSNLPFPEGFKSFDPVIYFNAGAWENFRIYLQPYPKEVIGKNMNGWEGEKWLNISDGRVFSTLVKNIEDVVQKIKIAYPNWVPKIDLDNLDSYNQKTGFKIDKVDQIRYINEIVSWFHKRFDGGVCVRNCEEIIGEIHPDAVLCEQGIQDNFLLNYANCDYPIFDIEYYKNSIAAALGKMKCKKYQPKLDELRFVGAKLDLANNFFNI
jgi:hypothetical protein